VGNTDGRTDDQETGVFRCPSAASVRAAVERIVASSDFIASERARMFLRYIVEEALEGRSDRIKAFSVAIEVFGRDPTFDAQNDPVVRIEAGRLRRALEHYYLLAGQDDPIIIEIPKGGYVPMFVAKPAGAAGVEFPSAPAIDPLTPPRVLPSARLAIGVLTALVLIIVGAVAWYLVGIPPFGQNQANRLPVSPTLLVLPFVDLGDGTTSALYSTALTDEIVNALADFKEITVFGVWTSRSVGSKADIGRLHDELKANYVLEGSVRVDDGKVRVSGRLLNAANGAVLWSQQFENSLTATNLLAIQASTAEEVATAIAQPYGIVFQTESARAPSQPPDDLDAYLCTLRYYVYRATPSPEGHATVRDCLERAVVRFPTYATAWALLAHIYLDEARHGLNPRVGEPDARQRALGAGREAVRLDPKNPRALQSLATTLFYTHHVDEAFEVADRAIALTPNDAELLGQIGQLVGLSGRLDKGRALLEQAVARNPGRSGFYRGALALIAYMQFDYDTALVEIDRADLQELPIYYGVAAIIYAQKGLDERARVAAREFQRLRPDFIPNLWAELDIRNIPPEIQLHIADGFRKAGMTVPRPAVSGDRGATE
jgi:adenylate cyclase